MHNTFLTLAFHFNFAFNFGSIFFIRLITSETKQGKTSIFISTQSVVAVVVAALPRDQTRDSSCSAEMAHRPVTCGSHQPIRCGYMSVFKVSVLIFISSFRLFLLFLFFRAKSETQASPGVKTKRSLPTRQVLAGYWGQNSIAYSVSRPNWEKDLRYFCNNHKFDIYLVAFVHRLFRNNRNRGTFLGNSY